MSAARRAAQGAAEPSAQSTGRFLPLTWMQEDGTLAFRGSYEDAVARLFAYECSGALPEDAGTGRWRSGWERYTFRAPGGGIFPRRGCERVLSRLWAYESFGLAPPEWARRYGDVPGAK